MRIARLSRHTTGVSSISCKVRLVPLIRMIDSRAPRVNQAFVGTFALIAAFTGGEWLLVLLAERDEREGDRDLEQREPDQRPPPRPQAAQCVGARKVVITDINPARIQWLDVAGAVTVTT